MDNYQRYLLYFRPVVTVELPKEDGFGPYEGNEKIDVPNVHHHPLCPDPDAECRCRKLYDKDYES